MSDKWVNYVVTGGYDEKDGLGKGDWVAGKNGVARWVPGQRPDTAPPVQEVVLPRALIACVCGATIDQPCKTESGNSTGPHKARVLERRCACGRSVSPQGRHARYCEGCRITARRETYKQREIRNPTAQRRVA